MGLTIGALNHLAHEIVAEDPKSYEMKIKKLMSEIGANDKDIVTYSIVISALSETTSYGDAVKYIRAKLVYVINPDNPKYAEELNSRADMATDVLKNLKDQLKISDITILKTQGVLLGRIAELEIQNQFMKVKINYFKSAINVNNYFSPAQIGGFKGGFGGGSYSGGGSITRY